MLKLTDAAPHSAMHAQLLNCLYHVTVLMDFNSETYKDNNLKKKTLNNCRSAARAFIVAFAFLRYTRKINDSHLHQHGNK